MVGSDAASAHEGRFGRTAWFAFLAAGWGSTLFNQVNDPLFAALHLVLMGYAMAGLSVEVHRQAHRRSEGNVDRWSRTDTGIVVVLVAFAALLSLSYAFASLPAPMRSASASFATLYLAVAVWFALTRRRSMAAT